LEIAMKLALVLVGMALVAAPAASAQEAIRTAGDEARPPPAGQAPAALPTVLAATASPDGAPPGPSASHGPPGCARAPDGKPHGEVWAGIGTRGYRNVGGVVTMPVGQCATLTLGVDHTQWR